MAVDCSAGRSGFSPPVSVCLVRHKPVFPDLARDVVPAGPNELWTGDLTYVAIATGFVYVALVLDAWYGRNNL